MSHAKGAGRLRVLLLGLAVGLGPLHPASARLAPRAAGGGSVTDAEIPRDNLKGRWLNYNTEPIDPILFLANGTFLVLNQPGSRLVVMDEDTLERLVEIPVGPGLVSMAARPGTPEVWCIDRVTASVSVVDIVVGRIERTIRVGAEPHDIAFSASGDRAYVTCSGVDRVDVVSTSTFEVLQSIPIPAREPRAIERVDTAVYLVSQRSGNGTAPLGNTENQNTLEAVSVEHTDAVAGTTPLPDRDLFRLPVGRSPGSDALDDAATRTGLGTTLYNLHRRPGTTELWIPHTDALNADVRGERNFVGGQVVRNGIAVVDVQTGGTQLMDLDALAPADEARCAPPTGIAFTSDGSRAFVCGYGSHSVAVLDIGQQGVSWAGTIEIEQHRLQPTISLLEEHSGAGPRCAAVSPDDSALVILNSGEESLTRIELADLPQQAGFVYGAPDAVSLGWDPTPPPIVQGRIDFNRTDNSKSKTSSCASCHIGGQSDGLAWDLSLFLDPEGTPSDELMFPLDKKGPMVTQSVRRLRETGPYHWRGERPSLFDFDAAFVGLLEREVNGQPKQLGIEFNYTARYMDTLALPPNPRQELDRRYTAEELEGAALFLQKPVLEGQTCVDCHTLPLGTSGEVVQTRRGGSAPSAVVPHLRGVADKLSPPWLVGSGFGERTELGAGLTHGGTLATLEDVALQPLPPPEVGQIFDVTADEADKIATFLRAFDSGLAPSAAYQATAHASNASSFLSGELAFLLAQAELGHCDVAFRYGPMWDGVDRSYPGGVYDPAIDRFRQASNGLAPLEPVELTNLAAAGMPVTFFGIPRLMGEPMGIDRDNDKLLDLDEVTEGTNPEWEDTDGDGFPDGHEVQWGTNPLVHNRTSPDAAPPTVTSAPEVIYATQGTIKFEVRTNEPVRVLVSYNGGPPVIRAPLMHSFDDAFSLILNGLEAGTSYDVALLFEDPAGNQSQTVFTTSTQAKVFPEPVHVEAIELSILPGESGDMLRAAVRLRRGASAPSIGYNLVGAVYHSTQNGVVHVRRTTQTWLAHPSGVANFFVPIPADIQEGTGELVFVLESVQPPPGEPPYAEAGDVESFKTLPY